MILLHVVAQLTHPALAPHLGEAQGTRNGSGVDRQKSTHASVASQGSFGVSGTLPGGSLEI